MNKFRTLRADEIECRVGTINANGFTLLLYKDARCDQNILDDTVGEMNWQRDHKEVKGNMFCGVSIYDEITGQWITKWDCGTESNTEKEKGEASDSFKRACFNWGIGRELYTAPFIWITSEGAKIEKNDNGKYTCKDNFVVEEIEYNDNREIIKLKIKNKTKRVVVFDYDDTKKSETDRLNLISEFEKLVLETGTDKELIYETYKVENNTQMTNTQLEQAIRKMKGKKK